jgi:hypothetical protein
MAIFRDPDPDPDPDGTLDVSAPPATCKLARHDRGAA